MEGSGYPAIRGSWCLNSDSFCVLGHRHLETRSPRHTYHSKTGCLVRPSRNDRSHRLVRAGRIARPSFFGRFPAARPRRLFGGLCETCLIVERFGHRIAGRIDAGQQFDPPFGLLQQAMALVEQLDPFFVAGQRFGQAQAAFFEIVNDLLEDR